MDKNLEIYLHDIQTSDASLTYISYRNLFEYITAPYSKFEVTVGHTILYRVRAHSEGDGNYFF